MIQELRLIKKKKKKESYYQSLYPGLSFLNLTTPSLMTFKKTEINQMRKKNVTKKKEKPEKEKKDNQK